MLISNEIKKSILLYAFFVFNYLSKQRKHKQMPPQVSLVSALLVSINPNRPISTNMFKNENRFKVLLTAQVLISNEIKKKHTFVCFFCFQLFNFIQNLAVLLLY